MSTDTVEPDAPEPAVPPVPDNTTDNTADSTTAAAVPAQAAEPAAETLPAASEDDVLGGGPERPAKRLSPRARLVATLLLGPVAGVGVGYAIQAARPATPLPALKAAKLDYPAARIDPKALAAAAPQPLNIDGDLRDLLVKRPDGAEDWTREQGNDGWMNAADMAETMGDSDRVFKNLLRSGFRRTAVVAWKADKVEYRVQLIQYRSDFAKSAIDAAVQHNSVNASVSKVPGDPDGSVTIPDKPDHYAESTEQFYYGEALARKGDVVMDIEVFSPNPVDKAQLEDLAKRQWERLA